jgi:Resolvase, N terminal domain
VARGRDRATEAVTRRRSREGLAGNGERREDRPRPIASRHAKGDVLMVTRLDRLARSTRDLLNTLAAITGKGAGLPQ